MVTVFLNYKEFKSSNEEDIICRTWTDFWSYIRMLQQRNIEFMVSFQIPLCTKMTNAMSYFSAIGVEYTWRFRGSTLENNGALNTARHYSMERSIQKELDDLRRTTAQYIHDYHIGIDVIANIDVYMIMCREHHIEVGQSLTLCEKLSVFAPTTLQAKQLNINPDYALVSSGKCKYIYTSTLLDKLKAYIELKWILALTDTEQSHLNDEQDYTTLTELTQKCISDTLEHCGRDYTVPLSAYESTDNFDYARVEKLLY